ncbi:anthranilate phosphoribosyltransferase [candidate division GN15 bacterium]|nr:anthranilate phosphoribosyltransferase [candidate division GN15 bacterium]
MKEILKKVTSGENLSRDECSQAMDLIMDGQATPSQIAGLVIALKMKGERPEEVAGFVESMRRHSLKVSIADDRAVDGVGTGGDGAHSFNISTAAGIVAAGAGATVAKHGNRSVTSKCGSADLLEAVGGKLELKPAYVETCINKVGFGFMFAPVFHPAMKHAAVPRREVGVRTVFNILGPLTNPAGVKRLLVGVYDKALMPLVAKVLALTGAERVMIVHSRDGLDEISVSAPTDYLELRDGKINEHVIRPQDVGLVPSPVGALDGGDANHNAGILRQLLDGQRDAYRDAVVLNAGAMLYIADLAESIDQGVTRAEEAIDAGHARAKLEQWVAVSNDGSV